MKKIVPAYVVLPIITATAALFLSVSNAITAPIIEARTKEEANGSRYAVFAEADTFEEMELTENAAVDNCYEAKKGGQVVGYVSTITVNGYGGEIEVTLGLDQSNVITGIHVGGPNFKETAGLGAKTKEPAFTEQFAGIQAPAVIGDNVDAVTGATISSGAVISGVNRIVKYVDSLGKDPNETDPYNNMLPENSTELPADETVERAYQTPDGYVVYTSAEGYHGLIHTAVAMDESGTVVKVAIDELNFNETAGLGELVLEESFLSQFVGKTGVVGVEPGKDDGNSSATADGWSGATPADGADSDATSAATWEESEDATPADGADSDSDATSAATWEESEDSAPADGSDSDATSAATWEESEDESAADGADSDAMSAATWEESDGTSSASIVIEEIENADVTIDGVSGATYSSLAVAKAVNAAIAYVQKLLS